MDVVTTAAIVAESHASGYRLKFDRDEFLKLVNIAKPRIIYRRGKNHLFAFDGFVMYSQRCRDEDFTATIIDTIEFSNYSWET